MARKFEVFDNIFAENERDFFAIQASNAQAIVSTVNNPYIGNKKKLLFDIAMNSFDVLSWKKIYTVCDVFAGSSVVGAFFKLLGKTVVSNELLLSSYMHGVSLMMSDDVNITSEEWEFLIKNQNPNVDGFILQNYLDSRFTKDECLFLDNFYANVVSVFRNRHVDYCFALSTILQFVMENCFLGGRLNSGQILAAKNHRIAHQRNKGSEMQFTKLQAKAIDINGKKSKFNHGDAIDFLQKNTEVYDLYYIDPPYGGDQSNYAQMYKFPEEYVNRKLFDEIEYLVSSSKKFCKNKTYRDSFINLLESIPQNSSWLFSYNDSSWSSVDDIVSILQKFRKNVIVKEIDYNYKQRDIDNFKGKEYLIFGTP